MINCPESWYFKVKIRWSIDAEYGTTYSAIQEGGFNKISYGTRAQAYAWGSVVFEYLEWYWFEEKVVIELFDVTPLEY